MIWKRWKREKTARLPVTVSSVQTWFCMQANVKKSSPGSTQLPTSRHLLSSPTVPRWHTHTYTPINRLWSPLAYGLWGNNYYSFHISALPSAECAVQAWLLCWVSGNAPFLLPRLYILFSGASSAEICLSHTLSGTRVSTCKSSQCNFICLCT